MKHKLRKTIAVASMFAALSLPVSNIQSNSSISDYNNVKAKSSPLFEKKMPMSSSIQKIEKHSVCFMINLAEFKDRLYIDGKLVDSSAICPGAYRKRSPVLHIFSNKLTIRPSFNPTSSESSRFRPNKPCRNNYPTRPTNALGRVRFVLDGTYRMHGTSSISSIGKIGADGHVIGKFRSNGCIRHDNLSIERMTGRLLSKLRIKSITSYLSSHMQKLIDSVKSGLLAPEMIVRNSKPGLACFIILKDSFELKSYYRVWDKYMQYSDSTITFTAFRDIYDYVNGRKFSRKIKFDKSLEENAYTKEHFFSDLNHNNIFIRDEFIHDSLRINSFWREVQKHIKQNKKVGKKITIKHNGLFIKKFRYDYNN